MRKRYISIISLILILILALTCIGCSDDSVNASIDNHSMPIENYDNMNDLQSDEKSNELAEITQQPEFISDTTMSTTVALLPWYDYPASPDLANTTGLYKLADGRWVYLNKGVIDVNYNDWAENEYGGYTVVNGFVDWSKPHYSKTTTTTTRYYTTAQKSSGGNSGSWGSGSSSGSKGNANQNTNSGSYILNTNSGIVHHSWCPSVKRMSEKNKSVVNSTAGYKLCKNCF